MHQTTHFITLALILSLATQPLLGMQTAPASSQKKGLIALAIGSATVIAATTGYLLLAKADRDVCKNFKKQVKAINTISKEQTDTSISIPPLSEITSSIPPHYSNHTKAFLSDNEQIKITMQHKITKKCLGLIHCHEFVTNYQPITQEDRADDSLLDWPEYR